MPTFESKNNDIVFIDPGASPGDPWVIKFPPNPINNFRLGVVATTPSAVPVTLDGNGKNIEGPFTPRTPTLDVDFSGATFNFVFNEPRQAWGAISSHNSLVNDAVLAGYGWGDQDSALPFTIPSGSWVTLPFEIEYPVAPFAPRYCSFDPVANNFTIDTFGVWLLMMYFNIEGHDSSNQGRSFQFRLFDETTGSPTGGGGVIGVGRNQEDTFVSLTSPIQVGEQFVGDTFRIELGNGDAITGGQLINSRIALVHASEIASIF